MFSELHLRYCGLRAIALLILFAFPVLGHAEVPSQPSREFREPDASGGLLQDLTVAVYLLAALTVGAVSFLLILMLWGARVRREARKPLPAVTPNDPLYYLKTKKKPPGEPSKPPAVSDGKSEQEPKTDPPSTP